MYHIPIEMLRQMTLDYLVIERFRYYGVTGVWKTFQGEIYVKEGE